LGKYQASNEEILNSTDVLILFLDPKDVLFPYKYKENVCYDIGLIGLSRENKLKLDQYI
jgi:hypothetical protein